jgi:toxin CcdB
MVVRRFDVFRNPSPTSSKNIPWFLVVQSDLLDAMDTCVVVPLARAQVARRAASERLNPLFKVEGADVVQLTQLVAAVPMNSLRKPVANLEPHREVILRAIDFLFSGI